MTKSRKKIFASSGSIRKDSSNEKILSAIANLYARELDIEIYKGLETLPYFIPGVVPGTIRKAL